MAWWMNWWVYLDSSNAQHKVWSSMRESLSSDTILVTYIPQHDLTAIKFRNGDGRWVLCEIVNCRAAGRLIFLIVD